MHGVFKPRHIHDLQGDVKQRNTNLKRSWDLPHQHQIALGVVTSEGAEMTVSGLLESLDGVS